MNQNHSIGHHFNITIKSLKSHYIITRLLINKKINNPESAGAKFCWSLPEPK